MVPPNQLTTFDPDAAAAHLSFAGATAGQLSSRINGVLSDRVDGVVGTWDTLRSKITGRITDRLAGPAQLADRLGTAADTYRTALPAGSAMGVAVVDPPGQPVPIQIMQIVTPEAPPATADEAARARLFSASSQVACSQPLLTETVVVPQSLANALTLGNVGTPETIVEVPTEPATANPVLLPGLTFNEVVCKPDGYVDALKKANIVEPTGREAFAKFFHGDSLPSKIGHSFASWLDTVLQGIFEGTGCGSAASIGARGLLLVPKFLEHWGGEAIEPLIRPLEYIANGLCPTEFPSAGEAIKCFLAGTITEEIAESWVKINGYCPEPHKLVQKASRTKLSVNEANLLRLRGKLSDSEWELKIRQLGYIDAEDLPKLWELTRYVPGFKEAFGVAHRDAASEAGRTNEFRSQGFDAFWGGAAGHWAQSHGLDKTTAQALWRAQWSLPSVGESFTAYHRSIGLPDDTPGKVLVQDVRKLMADAGVAPDWRDSLLLSLNQPLEKRDLRQASATGTLAKREVALHLEQIGYGPADAATVAETYDRLRNEALPNHRIVRAWLAGGITGPVAANRLLADGFDLVQIPAAMSEAAHAHRTCKWVKDFAQRQIPRQVAFNNAVADNWPADLVGELLADAAETYRTDPHVTGYDRGIFTRAETVAYLTRFGLTADEQARILDPLADKLAAEQRHVCVQAMVKRYMAGEFTLPEFKNQLLGIVNDDEMVSRVVAEASCQRSAIGKQASTSELCAWLGAGQILPADFVQRLQNIGWSTEDAHNLLTNCLSKVNERQAAEALKQAKADAAAIAKAQAKATKSAAMLSRLGAQQARAQALAMATTTRREAAIVNTAARVHKHDGGDLSDTLRRVKIMRNVVAQRYGLPPDDVIAVLVRASEQWAGKDTATYESRAIAMAEAVAADEQGGVAALSPESSSTLDGIQPPANGEPSAE